MQTLTAEEVNAQPQRLLDDARKGQADVITVDGEPAMLTLPLGPASGDSADRLNLAIALYERDQSAWVWRPRWPACPAAA